MRPQLVFTRGPLKSEKQKLVILAKISPDVVQEVILIQLSRTVNVLLDKSVKKEH